MTVRAANQQEFPKLLLLPGVEVQVRSHAEILRTLDEHGACDGLPFMPEMVGYCDGRFRILRRVSKTCCEVPQMEMRSFPGDNVVVLAGLHCSGQSHGGCQNGCLLFWKAAWLQPVGAASAPASAEDRAALLSRLKTTIDPDHYYCQATSLPRATNLLSSLGRLQKCFADIRYRTYSATRMIRLVVSPLIQKLRRRQRGEWPAGTLTRTPAESLNLQPGEWVEVKSIEEIVGTLDGHGKNRGLHFSSDMAAFCGKKCRVRNRLDRMMHEATGKLHDVRNTVVLENVTCQCPYTIGGCSRGQFQYWREIWLRRVPAGV